MKFKYKDALGKPGEGVQGRDVRCSRHHTWRIPAESTDGSFCLYSFRVLCCIDFFACARLSIHSFSPHQNKN